MPCSTYGLPKWGVIHEHRVRNKPWAQLFQSCVWPKQASSKKEESGYMDTNFSTFQLLKILPHVVLFDFVVGYSLLLYAFKNVSCLKTHSLPASLLISINQHSFIWNSYWCCAYTNLLPVFPYIKNFCFFKKNIPECFNMLDVLASNLHSHYYP